METLGSSEKEDRKDESNKVPVIDKERDLNERINDKTLNENINYNLDGESAAVSHSSSDVSDHEIVLQKSESGLSVSKEHDFKVKLVNTGDHCDGKPSEVPNLGDLPNINGYNLQEESTKLADSKIILQATISKPLITPKPSNAQGATDHRCSTDSKATPDASMPADSRITKDSKAMQELQPETVIDKNKLELSNPEEDLTDTRNSKSNSKQELSSTLTNEDSKNNVDTSEAHKQESNVDSELSKNLSSTTEDVQLTPAVNAQSTQKESQSKVVDSESRTAISSKESPIKITSSDEVTKVPEIKAIKESPKDSSIEVSKDSNEESVTIAAAQGSTESKKTPAENPQSKQNQPVTENHKVEEQKSPEGIPKSEMATLRVKDPANQNTKIFRESSIMKKKGKIYYKKKGPFSKWRSFFVILDDSNQQMCFFKSQEEYEKLARCKMTVDLRLIKKIKHQKPSLFQSNSPFKLYRRAGLSTIKLAADNEDDRARWITTIEDILERIKTTPERDSELHQRSSTLPNIKKSGDDVSSDSETCTASSAPEQDDLIRPKKISKSGFKIDSNQITSIKLKRTSSQLKETRDSKQPEEDAEEGNPQEKFGISLRRVQSEKPQPRDERESSPDYVEYKEKFNTLSLKRKNRAAPNIPLNANSVGLKVVDNIEEEEPPPTSLLTHPMTKRETLDTATRKRSPSPNLPISKGVETVMKNSDVSAQNLLSVNVICHATLAEVPLHESVEEDMKACDRLSEIQDSAITEEVGLGQVQVEELAETQDTLSVAIKESPGKGTIQSDNEDLGIESSQKLSLKCHSESETSQIIDGDANTISSPHSEIAFQAETSNDTPPNTPEEQLAEDPLKLNAIKKFISEMKSDASDSELTPNYPHISVEKSSREASPYEAGEFYPKEKRVEDASSSQYMARENVRLSAFSYGSQFSTESDEPLPRLNFLGKSDRSSTGSTVHRDASSSDEHKSERVSDSEDVMDQSDLMRDKSIKSKGLPGSSDSPSARSSNLVAPEFTVVEENAEEIIAATTSLKSQDGSDKKSSNSADETFFEIVQVEECQLEREELVSDIVTEVSKKNIEIKQHESSSVIDGHHKEDEMRQDTGEAEKRSVDHIKSPSDAEIVSAQKARESLQKEVPSPIPIAIIDSQKVEEEIEIKKPEKVMVRDMTKSGSETKDLESKEKCFFSKIEMNLSPKVQQGNTNKMFVQEKARDKPDVANELPDSLKLPEITVTTIETLNEKDEADSADDSRDSGDSHDSGDEIEVLESEETTDYFTPYGGAVTYRINEDPSLKALNEPMRSSGIVGLKEFLKDNEDPSSSSTEVRSGISRLGHSTAIEKLKEELPKQET